MGINGQLAWKFNDPKSQKFSQMLSRLRKPYNGLQQLDTADMENFASELAREVVFGPDGVQARLSGRGTGDWIVYLTHEGQNYYLCIAKHAEDEFILDDHKALLRGFSVYLRAYKRWRQGMTGENVAHLRSLL